MNQLVVTCTFKPSVYSYTCKNLVSFTMYLLFIWGHTFCDTCSALERLGSISAVSWVRSLILPEERRLDAWPVDLVCDAIGKFIIYASPMSLEVTPVSNFLLYLTQNCIKRSCTHPNDFRNSFSVHFCTLWHAVNFLWSSNGWKKRSKRRCSEKIKWKIARALLSFPFTFERLPRRLNGKVCDLPDRISSVLNVPLSNINVGDYICNERSYRDLKRLEKILEDARTLQQQSLKEEFTTNNRTKHCIPSDPRISPTVAASLHHAMDQGRPFCFDVIISATIFARRKSASGNMIGLNQQRKSHASSRSFGGMCAGSFSRTAAGNLAYAEANGTFF